MPRIRDFSYNYTTSTSGTTITVDVPYTVTDDLLICILGSDTGTGARTWTSTGWTSYTVQSNTTETRIMYRISTGGSEPESYTFTASAAETFNGIMISIEDINTSSPFAGVTKVNRAANNTAYGTISTSVDNTLLLFIAGHGSAAVIPTAIEGPCQFLFQMDGSAHADAVSWGFQATAGTTPNNVISSVSGTTYNGPLITLGINPPSGGATIIPTYCTADNSLYLDPFHGTTAFRGNTAPAATATTYYTTTVGGKSVANATISAQTDYGINPYRSCSKQTSSTNRTWQGIVTQFATAKTTIAGKNILLHIVPYLYADIQTLEAIGLQRGIAIGLHSSASNNKVWHVHGSGTPFGVRRTPVVVNTSNTSGVIGTQGTLNSNSIAGIGAFVSGFVVSADMVWTMAWALDTTTVCGGNSSYPIDVPGIINSIADGHERYSALQQGKNQMLVLQPFQIGNGGTNPTYLNLSTSAIEFPQQYNVSSRQVFYCSADNVAGVTFYPGSSDTIDIRSSVWSSANKFHWVWHASSSGSATVYTDGAQVIGAGTVTLNSGIDLIGITFQGCDQISAAGNTLTNVEFNQSTSSTGAFYITASSQANLQSALDNLVSCSFSDNTTPSGALRLVYTGSAGAISLSMSSGSFSGNTADIRWEAPSGSNLTLNLSGGADASTYSATNSNTVTFSNPKSFIVTNIIDGSEVRIYKQSDLSELGGAENVGASPSGLNNVTVASDPDNAGRYKVTYQYNYVSDLPIYIVVFHNSYQALRPSFTLKSTDSSLQVAQNIDRQYYNPA